MLFTHQINRRRCLGLAIVLVAAAGCQGSNEPVPELVAAYEGGTITRQEYAEWLLYKGADDNKGVEDDPAQRQQNFLSIALTKTLAASARRRGLREQPAIQATLFVREAQLLEKGLQQHVGESERWEKLRTELMQGVRIDLRLAQLVSTLDSRQVIEFPGGGGLALGEVRAWLKLRNARVDPADLPSEQFQELAEVLALQARTINRARELGLEENPEVAAGLTWGENEILLVEETKTRIQERYHPPTEEEIRARFEAEVGRLGAMSFEEALPQVQNVLRQESLRALQLELQNELVAQLAVRPLDQEKR
jgi:hypothetical protein